MFENLDNTQLAAHIADLEASKPVPTALDFEAHVNRLEAATRELQVRELTAQLAASSKSPDLTAQLELANTTISNLEAAAVLNAENVSQIEAKLETATADLEAANTSLTEVSASLEELQAAHGKLEKKAGAFEEFIQGQYGDDTIAAFKADGSGGISQPEVSKPEVPLTAAQQRAKNRKVAREMAASHMAKIKEANEGNK